MTGVSSPLQLNPSGPTVLLGYEPSLRMFAGFDVLRHRRFTPGSPSVQIDIGTVRRAITGGMAFDRKGNDEILCGVRPDQMMNYITTAGEIHRYGKQAPDFRVLTAAVEGAPVPETDMALLSGPRKRVVGNVSRLVRNANFRRIVLQAYDNRCAVTGSQLKLVDAAHILPVGAPRSADHVTNGIALSPTYHRAFDRGLIYLDEERGFQINEDKIPGLEVLRLTGGLGDLRATLSNPPIMPANRDWWPSLTNIRRANRYRGVA